MPSKQDIAIAKGLAKEAGKMVAEELAKMLVPGIGWATGLVSVVKLFRALDDRGDDSRPVEIKLRVAQDARFLIRQYQRDGQYVLDDFFDVEPNKVWQKKKLPIYRENKNPIYRSGGFVRVGAKFEGTKFNTAGEMQSTNFGWAVGNLKTQESGTSVSGSQLIVGFNRNKAIDLKLIATGPDTLVAQAIIAEPRLKQYETELLAGANITIAALKVSAVADLFDTDMKPKFNENNPAPLIAYGEAIANYAQLVKSIGSYPGGVAFFGDPISFTVLLGELASQIATAFGLELGADFVTFTDRFTTKKNTVRGVYLAHLQGAIKPVPGTSATIDVSMPGSPLDKPAATPPPPSLPEAIYTTMPVAGRPMGPSVIAIGEDGRVVTSKDLRPIQNTLAPSKAEQQLGKLGLVENVSTASEPGTKPAGATDRSVLVLLAAAAAAVALL
jgi:hypothetical protein